MRTPNSLKDKTLYYIAYDAKKGDGEIVGIAYQKIGIRGGKKRARWLEPVGRQVTSAELKWYKFYSYRVPAIAINWGYDEYLRTMGKHIES